ncbi:MAG: ArsR family transcriptional regulator [Paracoccaceae bacterium]
MATYRHALRQMPKALPLSHRAGRNRLVLVMSPDPKIRHFGNYRIMDKNWAIEVFSALAQSTRILVFRLLVRVGPAGLPTLEISRRLEIVPSTLSGHLSILKRSGILTATRHQREIHYAANLAAVNELTEFLLSDCCGGQISNCSDILLLLDFKSTPADVV